MTQEMIDMLEEEGYIPTGKARPPQGEMVPKLGAVDAVVFKDFFCLRRPPSRHAVLSGGIGSFRGTTSPPHPNGIRTLSKFC
jgi:hypothetical protein